MIKIVEAITESGITKNYFAFSIFIVFLFIGMINVGSFELLENVTTLKAIGVTCFGGILFLLGKVLED